MQYKLLKRKGNAQMIFQSNISNILQPISPKGGHLRHTHVTLATNKARVSSFWIIVNKSTCCHNTEPVFCDLEVLRSKTSPSNRIQCLGGCKSSCTIFHDLVVTGQFLVKVVRYHNLVENLINTVIEKYQVLQQ